MLEVSANARVQPSSCRRYANGAAATIAPSCPVRPVSWVTIGAWRTRNQTATRRMTLTKIIASPAPTTARDSTAPVEDVLNAKASWPAVISASPLTAAARGAEAVEQDADRHLHAGVHDELEDRERRQAGGVDVEPVGGDDAGDTQRAAVEDRQDVDRQRGAPDGPRPAAADVVDLLGRHRDSMAVGPGGNDLSPARGGAQWQMKDSNLRRRKPTDLQSAPIGRSGNLPVVRTPVEGREPRRKDSAGTTPDESPETRQEAHHG